MDEISLDEYRRLTAGKPARPKRAKATHPALSGPPVGSSYQGRLDKAAANGWHAIESPDALRYRWRTNAGRVGPWGSYEETTAWGTKHRPGESDEL